MTTSLQLNYEYGFSHLYANHILLCCYFMVMSTVKYDVIGTHVANHTLV